MNSQCGRIMTLGTVLLFAIGWTMAQQVAALPFLSPIFTENMVLQRNAKDAIWGWTAPGTTVTVTIGKEHAKAIADAKGKWLATIGPCKAGGPYTLTVRGPQTVTLQNVLFGDVWICSGQSNMEMGVGLVKNAQQEIAAADYPQIRLCILPHAANMAPQPLTECRWNVCSPATVSQGGWSGFSAAAYFFGRQLYHDLHVPIGLIQTCWSGTPAEAWTNIDALRTMADYRQVVSTLDGYNQDASRATAYFRREMDAWWRANDPGSKQGWEQPAFDTSTWPTMKLPTQWENAGLPNFDGTVWFRITVKVPTAWVGHSARLNLGAIDDRDSTFVNGVLVGNTDAWNAARHYVVPAGVLKAGDNVIAVRVLDIAYGGGLWGNGNAMNMAIDDDSQPAIALETDWHYHVGAALNTMSPPPLNQDSLNCTASTVLYNGMIAPLVPLAVKGVIWYQGEANAGRGQQYRTLLPTMIKGWRTQFGQQFPFLVVQLANFGAPPQQPDESAAWAEIREAQLLTAQQTPHVGLIVTTDIGDATDIHPKNKQEVGRRLGLVAKALAYGKKLAYSGAMYDGMKVEGASIRLSFTQATGGLIARGGELAGFAIAGADKHFVWAHARIDGSTVVVSSSDVTAPVAVRYAWANNPEGNNLYNGAGLPASPFRTDK